MYKMEKVNKKHKYSTVLLISMAVLIFVAAIGAFDTGDVEILCSTDNAVLKRISGVWGCSLTNYAEGFYYSNFTNPSTITIDASDTSYNITDFSAGNYQGMTFSQNGIDVTKTGIYRLTGSISFTGGNNGEYSFIMTKNGIPIKECGAGMTSTSVVANIGITCLADLTSGDHLNMIVRDHADPSQDVDIYRLNLNIVEVV